MMRVLCLLIMILLQVIQLRKACSHPYLFPGIEPEPYQEGEHLVQVVKQQDSYFTQQYWWVKILLKYE